MCFYITGLIIANLLCLFIIAGGVESKQRVLSEFKGFSYSTACVVKAVASCELVENSNCADKGGQVYLSLSELQNFLQEFKCNTKVINCSSSADSSVNLKLLLQELYSLKREQGNFEIKDDIKRLTNSCAEIREQVVSNERKHSEIKEIKSLLQEMMQRLEKSEKISETIERYFINFTISNSEKQESKLEMDTAENNVIGSGGPIQKKVKPIKEEMDVVGNELLKTKIHCQPKNQDFNRTLPDERNGSTPGGAFEMPKNCQEVRDLGNFTSGVRTIYPYKECPENSVLVFCDQDTDGGGWTVFQNRDALPNREKFERKWDEYVKGFGNITGEYWLGLDHLRALVSSTPMELRVDLEDYEGEKRWAKYGIFSVGDAHSRYTLKIGNYSGDAGDSMVDEHNGMKFSTFDQDNDINHNKNCAQTRRGAWWYWNCHDSNLNGYQYIGNHSSFGDGINWTTFQGWYYSLKRANMKIRPAFK